MLKNIFNQCLQNILVIFLLLYSATLYASFIESSVGAAVVNDATAVFFNPAGLTLIKNPQIISLNSVAYFQSEFNGSASRAGSNFTQSGHASSNTHYFLPSFYVGLPIFNYFTAGLGVVANDFNNEVDNYSILRYVQSNNHIQNVDLVPAVGFKFNDSFAIGANLNISHANFLLEPIIGIPSLNIPDSQSRNKTSSTGYGGDIGIIIKPTKSTMIGFNYRSLIEYKMNGTSTFFGNPIINSNNYHFKFWTPARNVFSINQFVTQKLGFIATIQRIDWSVFKNLHVFGIATPFGILNEATIPYHLHNTWLLTLGSHYKLTSKWIVRIAATYNQKPSDGHFQISTGDSFIVGASTSYALTKNISIDGSYAHAFIADQNINIMNTRNLIQGVNKAFRDSISLKLTLNI